MKKVIDANYFRIQEFHDYLSSDSNNIAVFTDFACMESYKGTPTITIHESLKIISKFPKQIVILKGTQDITHLTCVPFSTSQFIDQEQTNNFSKFCRYLNMAKNGNKTLNDQIEDHGREANAHFKKMLNEAESLGETYSLIRNTYTSDELRELRDFSNKNDFSDQTIKKIITGISLLSKSLYEGYPVEITIPSQADYPNSYIFRFAVCGYFLAISRIVSGGANDAKPEKLRNDIVDISYATYASYFDGLLTNDKRLQWIYEEANLLIKNVFNP